MEATLAAAARAVIHSARDPQLRRAQGAFLLYWTGEWAFNVGIGILAYRDGGALAVGLIGLLRMGPAALVAPFAASLADRVRRDRVLWVLGVFRAVASGAVALAVVNGSTTAAYVLVVVSSVAGVLYRPAHSALLPSLCRSAQQLAGTHAARGLLDAAGCFLGPLVATVLLGAGRLDGVFVAAAVISLASSACLIGLRYESPEQREPVAPVRFVADARQGAAAVLADPALRALFALATVQTFVRGALGVFVVVLAVDVLDAGEAGAGALTTAMGAGALLASLAVSLLAHSRHLAVWTGIGTALWGLPLLGAGVTPTLLVTALLLALVGVGNALVDVGLFTVPARLVPDRVLGRVFALLEAMGSLAVAVGGLAAPLLIDLVGVTAAVALVGATAPAVTAVVWRRLRVVDREMRHRDGQVAVLAAVPMLAPLPMPAVERLAARLAEQGFAAGAEVVRQADAADSFFLLLDGVAEVLHDGALVRTLHAGDGFGEVALLRDTVRTATVRATTDVRTWVLLREDFLAAVEGYASSNAEAQTLLQTLVFVPEPRRPDVPEQSPSCR